MLLNNVEVKVLASIELIDAYNKQYPENFINDNVIYCIHNKINGKNYIGQTSNFKGRYSECIIGHFKCYNDFINGNPIRGKYLYNSWRKYGFESFIVYIIDVCNNRKEMNDRELYWIKTLHTCVKDSNCFGYNLTWGADDLGNLNSPEALAKGRETKKERYGTSDPFINSHTPEAKEKRRQSLIKKFGAPTTVTKDSIEKMLKTKLDRYGTTYVGNTIESRALASSNKKLTEFFKRAEILIKKYNISSFEEYCNASYEDYSENKRAKKAS